MAEIAIRADQISKSYVVGAREQGYKTAREAVMEALQAPLRRLRKPATPKDDLTLWALKGVSFSVEQGEVVGIVGRNGAGKSTLLKLLSRITEPTTGRIEVHGRLASLLEVGTGFHPELTGRENIFLNGAILGMTRQEIFSKFDEIVAFAEVERFIDTPVKRYSSGMYLRLAFAVAAHLQSEILVVDEVLSVGDAAFQERCISRMKETASDGRTVLYVSHNLPSVQHLCTRAILLRQGQVFMSGSPSEVIGEYLSEVGTESFVDLENWTDRSGSGEARLTRMEVIGADGRQTSTVQFGSSVQIRLRARFNEPMIDPCFGVVIHSGVGEHLMDIRSNHEGLATGRTFGEITLNMTIPTVHLYPGRYYLSPWICDAAVQTSIDFPKHCCSFDVEPAPGEFGDLKLDPAWGKYWVKTEWSADYGA